jgi:hypothetical protein
VVAVSLLADELNPQNFKIRPGDIGPYTETSMLADKLNPQGVGCYMESHTPPKPGSHHYTIKDSGKRKEFGSGMVRDTTEGKINFLLVRYGPMLRRWATHLTKGEKKYPEPAPDTPNWTLAAGPEELARFRQSAARHFEQWVTGENDEDHAAAIFFNVNGAEYVKERMRAEESTYSDFLPHELP